MFSQLVKNRTNALVIGIALVMLAINMVLSYFEIYYFNLLPVLFVFAYIAFTRLDTLLLITVFFVPLSIPLKEIIPGLPFDFYMPTEPILFGILVLFVLKAINGQKFDKKILYHPVSLVILVNLIWLFITSITSSMPLVSFKFLLSRMWFIVCFYLIASQLFRNTQNIKKYIWAYVFGLIIVIGYTITRHMGYGLYDKQASHFVMTPFYNDHTSYGAVLAMFIPVLIGFSFIKRDNLTYSVFNWLVIAVLILAVILSYTRAAWLSLVGVLGIFVAVRLRIKFSFILIGVGIVLALFFVYRVDIQHKLENNRQDSSADLSEHVKSISNISTDASNLERLNRWNCAFKMFRERPVFGWGPGTYQFQYAPFQMARDQTIISTNFGNMGNAHSEYIGPLSESGAFGTISFIAILIVTLLTGFRVYWRSKEKEIRILSLTLTLGLITYYVHGILNNFLDTDKASAPFWGFTAMLVAMDVYHRSKAESIGK